MDDPFQPIRAADRLGCNRDYSTPAPLSLGKEATRNTVSTGNNTASEILQVLSESIAIKEIRVQPEVPNKPYGFCGR